MTRPGLLDLDPGSQGKPLNSWCFFWDRVYHSKTYKRHIHVPSTDVNCSIKLFAIFVSDCCFSHNNWELKSSREISPSIYSVLISSNRVWMELAGLGHYVWFGLEIDTASLFIFFGAKDGGFETERIFSCSTSFLGDQQTNSFILPMEIKAVTYALKWYSHLTYLEWLVLILFFLLAGYDIQDLANLTDLLSNYDHSCRGHDLGWVICCIQHYAMTTFQIRNICWKGGFLSFKVSKPVESLQSLLLNKRCYIHTEVLDCWYGILLRYGLVLLRADNLSPIKISVCFIVTTIDKTAISHQDNTGSVHSRWFPHTSGNWDGLLYATPRTHLLLSLAMKIMFICMYSQSRIVNR